MVEKYLQLESFQAMTYSLTDLIQLSENLTSYQLKKVGQCLTQLKSSSNEMQETELSLQDFLANAPPKVAQLLIAVFKSKDVDFNEEVDAETLKKIVPGIQRLDEMLKGAGIPEDTLKLLSEFAEKMQKKHDQTLSTLTPM